MGKLRKLILGGAVVASALAAANPAAARDDWHRHRGDDTAAIVGAGALGLALGAAIASDRDDRYYYDRGYYHPRYYPRYRTYYVYRDYPRYYRDYDRRWYRPHGRYYDGYERRWHHRGW